MTDGAGRAPSALVEGARVVVTPERVAHGGHVVARHDGRVLFVRHALPGETVEVEITGQGPKGRFLRADVVRVIEPSQDRVEPPCRHAGVCGGCDWQHVSLDAQRRLKGEVLREQLTRLGGVHEIDGVPLQSAVDVAAIPGDADGLGWRTRVRYAVDAEGRPGFRRHRSHVVEPVERCPLVTDAVDSIGVTRRTWSESSEIEVVASSHGERAVVVEPSGRASGRELAALPSDVSVPGLRGRTWVREEAGGREWRVAAQGFWQVHPGAADALVDAVRAALQPRPGERLVDLYAGVGLFAGCLADDVGVTGSVDAVEASIGACRDARRNLHDLAHVRIHQAPVERWLASGAVTRADVVVLDPPRSGAGADVIDRVIDLGPRAVAYVACDPASLGRDVGHARSRGWQVGSVRGFDLFPMTQHLEAVALLVPPS
jgi:tRNA/tmRNA/rRNA uracil-C5-methylase (TrmA/RlmC/RlmD family)